MKKISKHATRSKTEENVLACNVRSGLAAALQRFADAVTQAGFQRQPAAASGLVFTHCEVWRTA